MLATAWLTKIEVVEDGTALEEAEAELDDEEAPTEVLDGRVCELDWSLEEEELIPELDDELRLPGCPAPGERRMAETKLLAAERGWGVPFLK